MTPIYVSYHASPGGHWNVAYPFVTLHQPSSFYGVSSRALGTGKKDEIGLNKGLMDLASGAEVLAYFDDVMRHVFLPTGRVQYFPLCDYDGDFDNDHSFASKLTSARYQVSAAKVVDATYLKTSTPSTHTPNFDIADGVTFMPLNDLPNITQPPEGYCVIGGGKTGIDACLWLIENGVDPDAISWVVSRDAWLLNRTNTQPSVEFFENTIGAQANQFEAIAAASDMDDMFDKLEACGYFLRLDKSVRPQMFHGATVSPLELEQLRRIKNIIRMGRVTQITQTQIVLDEGTVPTTPQHVHVDCSASAITNIAIKPVFEGHLITPQTVRSYQPVFSAAFIAYIEASKETIAEKNKFCTVVPLPNSEADYMRMTAAFMMNQYTWSQDKDIREWLLGNRLDGFSKMVRAIDPDDAPKKAILTKLRDNAFPAAGKLQQFIAAL